MWPKMETPVRANCHVGPPCAIVDLSEHLGRVYQLSDIKNEEMHSVGTDEMTLHGGRLCWLHN